ncbi:GatA family leaderless bacteriocin [Priestia aryabhattai]|nr:GatA family leaderless bacteriocin [Priestia aryabhattai]MED4261501.1 GatA family leaderless bacteriocin [Priestia aryabhattai]
MGLLGKIGLHAAKVVGGTAASYFGWKAGEKIFK